MLPFPLAEMVETRPEVGVVDHKVGLSPFFAQTELLPHVLVVIQRKSFEF